MNTRKPSQRILSTLLSATLLCGCATSSVAATSFDVETTIFNSYVNPRFNDVPTSFWAYEAIHALAEGGMVNGYGGGAFGPSDSLNIDQMATIICSAKGYDAEAKNGYWAYEAVEYCITNRSLPNLGAISSDVYSTPCTREPAVYMMVEALGSAGKTPTDFGIKHSDIPDYGSITYDYRDSILEAYQLGLVAGVDDNRTFNPSEKLTRAALCTVLYRAGFTEAAATPDDVAGEGLTGEELYDTVASWGWKEWNPGPYKVLTATDPLLGGIEVGLNAKGLISIKMPEENLGAYVVNGVAVDKHGTSVDDLDLGPGGCNKDGVHVMSSGWSYEARQKVKDILKLAYPTGYEEAYTALVNVMTQQTPIYEVPTQSLPSALRWIDGRAFKATLDQTSHTAFVYIPVIGNESYYNSAMSGAAVALKGTYNPANLDATRIPTMYEFNKG